MTLEHNMTVVGHLGFQLKVCSNWYQKCPFSGKPRLKTFHESGLQVVFITAIVWSCYTTCSLPRHREKSALRDDTKQWLQRRLGFRVMVQHLFPVTWKSEISHFLPAPYHFAGRLGPSFSFQYVTARLISVRQPNMGELEPVTTIWNVQWFEPAAWEGRCLHKKANFFKCFKIRNDFWF